MGRFFSEANNSYGFESGLRFLPVDGYLHCHHLILRTIRLRVQHIARYLIDEDVGKVEGRTDHARPHLVSEAYAEARFAAGRADLYLLAVRDVAGAGVVRVEEQEVLAEDVRIRGAACHGAAVVVLQTAVGGEDERVVVAVLLNFPALLEINVEEASFAELEGIGVEDFGTFTKPSEVS